MYLIVNECVPSIYQTIRASENLNLVAIRPHLYIHNSPSGTVRVEIQDENGRSVDTSNSLTISTLKTDAFAHGYYQFDIDVPLIADQNYRIAIICEGGYSFAEAAYVAVCKDWDNPKTNADYLPNTGGQAPLDIELWFRSET